MLCYQGVLISQEIQGKWVFIGFRSRSANYDQNGQQYDTDRRDQHNNVIKYIPQKFKKIHYFSEYQWLVKILNSIVMCSKQ